MKFITVFYIALFLLACTIKTQPKTETNEVNKDLQLQLDMTPKAMAELRKIGVKKDKMLRLEYFFYTPKIENARNLVEELEKMNYKVEYGLGADTSVVEYVITGVTTKMVMNDDTVLQWTKDMWELGYKYNADFDGWGTSPDMEEFNK